jgi:hypothetical protein
VRVKDTIEKCVKEGGKENKKTKKENRKRKEN